MAETSQQTERPRKTGVNELSDLKWAVIPFESCEASSLTYQQAFGKLREIETRRAAGLCIATAETADRGRS